MIPVARFNRAEDVHRGNIGAGEGAVVHNLFNTRARGCDLGREISQTAGSIADHCGETTEPSIRDKAALDDATEDVWIDVATAEKKDDALARELRQLSRKAGGERSRGGAFHDAF